MANIAAPLFSLGMTASHTAATRTAVSKVRPGVFRIMVTPSFDTAHSAAESSSMSGSAETGAAAAAARREIFSRLAAPLVLPSLPPLLRPSSSSSSGDLALSRHATGAAAAGEAAASGEAAAVEGVLVALGSDEAADAWIEDLLRAAIRKNE